MHNPELGIEGTTDFKEIIFVWDELKIKYADML